MIMRKSIELVAVDAFASKQAKAEIPHCRSVIVAPANALPRNHFPIVTPIVYPIFLHPAS